MAKPEGVDSLQIHYVEGFVQGKLMFGGSVCNETERICFMLMVLPSAYDLQTTHLQSTLT